MDGDGKSDSVLGVIGRSSDEGEVAGRLYKLFILVRLDPPGVVCVCT